MLSASPGRHAAAVHAERLFAPDFRLLFEARLVQGDGFGSVGFWGTAAPEAYGYSGHAALLPQPWGIVGIGGGDGWLDLAGEEEAARHSSGSGEAAATLEPPPPPPSGRWAGSGWGGCEKPPPGCWLPGARWLCKDKPPRGPSLSARHGWNQVELLGQAGSRLRLAVNGVELLDYPCVGPANARFVVGSGSGGGDTATTNSGGGAVVGGGGAAAAGLAERHGGSHRIALQQPLAAAGEVVEMHYRGLLLAERPEDRLLTVR